MEKTSLRRSAEARPVHYLTESKPVLTPRRREHERVPPTTGHHHAHHTSQHHSTMIDDHHTNYRPSQPIYRTAHLPHRESASKRTRRLSESAAATVTATPLKMPSPTNFQPVSSKTNPTKLSSNHDRHGPQYPAAPTPISWKPRPLQSTVPSAAVPDHTGSWTPTTSTHREARPRRYSYQGEQQPRNQSRNAEKEPRRVRFAEGS